MTRESCLVMLTYKFPVKSTLLPVPGRCLQVLIEGCCHNVAFAFYANLNQYQSTGLLDALGTTRTVLIGNLESS